MYLGLELTAWVRLANVLREKCTASPGICMPATDDYVFVTKHWDSVVREALNHYPDRILLAYPAGPTAGPDQLCIGCRSDASWWPQGLM